MVDGVPFGFYSIQPFLKRIGTVTLFVRLLSFCFGSFIQDSIFCCQPNPRMDLGLLEILIKRRRSDHDRVNSRLFVHSRWILLSQLELRQIFDVHSSGDSRLFNLQSNVYESMIIINRRKEKPKKETLNSGQIFFMI